MKSAHPFFPCLAATPAVSGVAVNKKAASPPYFILIDDSTVTDNAGWGGSFVSLITGGAEGENRAVSGHLGELQSPQAGSPMAAGTNCSRPSMKPLPTGALSASLEYMTTQLKEAGATPISISQRICDLQLSQPKNKNYESENESS